MPSHLLIAESALPLILFKVIPYLGIAGLLAGVGRAILMRGKEAGGQGARAPSPEQERTLRMIPLHVGIYGLIFFHALAFLLPNAVQWWNSHHGQRALLETLFMATAFYTAFSLVHLLSRPPMDKSFRKVILKSDGVILAVMLLAALTCAYSIGTVRWATNWFGTIYGPYVWSVLTFNPNTALVAQLPRMAQIQILAAFMALGAAFWSPLTVRLLLPAPRLWGFNLFEILHLRQASVIAARASGVSLEEKD